MTSCAFVAVDGLAAFSQMLDLQVKENVRDRAPFSAVLHGDATRAKWADQWPVVVNAAL